jgi:hypothetical protein
MWSLPKNLIASNSVRAELQDEKDYLTTWKGLNANSHLIMQESVTPALIESKWQNQSTPCHARTPRPRPGRR